MVLARRCLVKSVGTAGKDKKGNPIDAGVCVSAQLGKLAMCREQLQSDACILRQQTLFACKARTRERMCSYAHTPASLFTPSLLCRARAVYQLGGQTCSSAGPTWAMTWYAIGTTNVPKMGDWCTRCTCTKKGPKDCTTVKNCKNPV